MVPGDDTADIKKYILHNNSTQELQIKEAEMLSRTKNFMKWGMFGAIIFRN